MDIALDFESDRLLGASPDLQQQGCHNVASSLGSKANLQQVRLEDKLAETLTWKAYLPFNDVLGFSEVVNLFDFIGRKDVTIKFDPSKWTPTDEGRKALMMSLQTTANHYGTILNPNGKGVLLCSHGRSYRTSTKANSDADDVNGRSADQFDDNGILIGLRGHQFHNNRQRNRVQGHCKKRGTSTKKDTTGMRHCKLRLTLNIKTFWSSDKSQKEAFINLSHHGECMHTYHPQPQAGQLPMRKQHLDDDTRDLIQNGARFGLANTSSISFWK